MREAATYILILMLSGSPVAYFRVVVPAVEIRPLELQLRVDSAKMDRLSALLGLPQGWWVSERSRTVLKREPESELAKRPVPATANAAGSVASDIAAALKPNQPAANAQPSLDFSKIAPDGTSVFAGRADPGSRVTVTDGDRPVGTTTVGPDGEWSLSTEHKFSSAEPKVAVRPATAADDVKVADAKPAPKAPEAVAAPKADSPAAASPAAQLVEEFKAKVEAARQESKMAEAAQATPDPPHSAIEWPVVPGPAASSNSAPQRVADAKTLATDGDGSIPLPMQFVYKEATLTSEGREAVGLLLEYLRLKRLDAVTLSGHADERGGTGANMRLSEARLVTIEQRLRDGGYGGKIKLIPKGESEPYARVDRTKFSTEELMQLDRRVELRLAP